MCQDPLYPAGYDAAIVDVLQRYNIPATFFMGGDWMRTHPDETKLLASNPNFDAATILAEVERTVRDGSIVIMHGNGRGWHTAEALPLIIDYLHDRGYTLVTVSQLIGLDPLPAAE